MTELDPEIAAMLRREGTRVDVVPADAAARMAERLATSVAAAGVAATAATGSSLAMKALPWVLTLAVGAGLAALVVNSLNTPTPTPIATVTSTATATAPAIPAPSSSIATVSVDSLPSAAPLPPAATATLRTITADADVEDSFVAERKILDAARKALATGDHAGAMRALDEHAKTHANGRLVEEREAILVRTLASSGRLDEARAAAARFRARFPSSVLLPAVEAAIQPP